MSMDVGGAKGGIKSDINVTPLVDVMLVLLIIMMIIAPMLQKGVDVKLPTASNTVDKPEVQDQTVVAVSAEDVFDVCVNIIVFAGESGMVDDVGKLAIVGNVVNGDAEAVVAVRVIDSVGSFVTEEEIGLEAAVDGIVAFAAGD